MEAYCKVFGKAFDAAPLAWILTVKPLWIKLVAQTQRFVFLVQSRKIRFGGGGKVKPFGTGGFFLQLTRALVLQCIDRITWDRPTAFFSFLVSGLPDFVSSGGGAGGTGAESDEDDPVMRSASRSRTANGASLSVFPSVM